MRLLLAEDEKEMAHALEAVFTHNHYSVDVVYNGIDAADWAESGNYDGMILDIMMPVMDGLEATRRIRAMKRPDARTIPIIAMTANAFADDIQQSLVAGMNAHISKPMDMGVLRKTVVKVISETPQTPMVVRIAGTKEIPKPRR